MLFHCCCTQVSRVYLLVRAKKTQTATQRVEKLLCDPLFHQLHEQVGQQQEGVDGAPLKVASANVFQKVHIVEGDLCRPDLGLSAADKAALLAEVNHVIHSAANIELDADIQWTIQ